MLTLTIKSVEEDRVLSVSAETMKDLVDIELPKWLPLYEKDKEIFCKCDSYILDPKGFEKKEKNSGWYYDL